MSAVTLEQLKAYEAKLIRALGDPTKAVFYDDFKRENRPISEVQAALAAVRAEIALATPADAAAPAKPSRILTRHRSAW